MQLTYHHEDYIYEADTGTLISPHGNILRGKTVHLKSGSTTRSRFIWFIVHGEWPKGHIVHLDGNSKNDCLGNLRDMPINHKQCYNKQKKWKGLFFYSRNTIRPWIVRITTADKKRKIVGNYKTQEEAIKAHKIAVQERDTEILKKANQNAKT